MSSRGAGVRQVTRGARVSRVSASLLRVSASVSAARDREEGEMGSGASVTELDREERGEAQGEKGERGGETRGERGENRGNSRADIQEKKNQSDLKGKASDERSVSGVERAQTGDKREKTPERSSQTGPQGERDTARGEETVKGEAARGERIVKGDTARGERSDTSRGEEKLKAQDKTQPESHSSTPAPQSDTSQVSLLHGRGGGWRSLSFDNKQVILLLL